MFFITFFKLVARLVDITSIYIKSTSIIIINFIAACRGVSGVSLLRRRTRKHRFLLPHPWDSIWRALVHGVPRDIFPARKDRRYASTYVYIHTYSRHICRAYITVVVTPRACPGNPRNYEGLSVYYFSSLLSLPVLPRTRASPHAGRQY